MPPRRRRPVAALRGARGVTWWGGEDALCPAATWGSTAAERQRPFPCDRYLSEHEDALYRAVDVAAPARILFRWLCQLKVAPYSYDWIDNLGRRSPRRLVPGLEKLEVGQRVMGFELVDFESDRQLTLLLRGSRVVGDVAVTYLVVPDGERHSRLLVKLLVRYTQPPGLRTAARWLVPTLDLVMMRKQLLTLKQLAEHQAREEETPASRTPCPARRAGP
jgi:hypothetical protein